MQISELTPAETGVVSGGGELGDEEYTRNGSQGRSNTGTSDGNGGAPSVSYNNTEANTGRHTTRVDPYCLSLGFSAQDCTSSR